MSADNSCEDLTVPLRNLLNSVQCVRDRVKGMINPPATQLNNWRCSLKRWVASQLQLLQLAAFRTQFDSTTLTSMLTQANVVQWSGWLKFGQQPSQSRSVWVRLRLMFVLSYCQCKHKSSCLLSHCQDGIGLAVYLSSCNTKANLSSRKVKQI